VPKWGEPIDKESLQILYFKQGLSAQEVADRLGFSYQYLRQFLAKHSATLYLAVKCAAQPPDVGVKLQFRILAKVLPITRFLIGWIDIA